MANEMHTDHEEVSAGTVQLGQGYSKAVAATNRLGDALREAKRQYIERRVTEGVTPEQAADEWFFGKVK